MRCSRVLTIALMLLVTVAISGCDRPFDFMFGNIGATPSTGNAGQARTATATASGGSVTDNTSLVAALKSAGAAVRVGDEVEQPFFSVVGKVLEVNGQEIQVFEYPDAASANAEAGQVSADGGSVGTTKITWIAPPHFFKAGRVIVLYVGSDSSVLNALKAALGTQFAGR